MFNHAKQLCLPLCILVMAPTYVVSDFAAQAEGFSNSQLQTDRMALDIAYKTDFHKKINPGLYLSLQSGSILELFNNAEFVLASAQQWSQFSLSAYLCFTEPTTDGCEFFNDLGCEAMDKDCGFGSKKANEIASLCTARVEGRKQVLDDCFIVTLVESADGTMRDSVAPWNSAMQDWFDSHNCTALMYHLKYRCHATLIKWNGMTASEEYVDLDQLFESTFGITSISHFNDQDPLICSSLTENDRSTLRDAAKIQIESAVLTFVTTAASLARFGMHASDVMYREAFMPQQHVQDKLRAALLINLFYDGAVSPFRELCCAENMCYDFHPMDVLVDKVSAFNTFYPGGLLPLASEASVFSKAPDVGQVHAATDLPITTSDAYVYNVLRNAPARAAWQAAASLPLTPLEKF